MTTEGPDPVNNPEHYNKLDVEAIDLIEMSMTRNEFLGYLKGNVLKYIIRYRHKGKAAEDLGKCIWYLTRLKDKVEDAKSTN
mgnify:FL=1|jgi:hypothetical protein|tara:strand:- start:630 stop:875 length:246 start_codon:yes stop_codon:yes gene_type:complete